MLLLIEVGEEKVGGGSFGNAKIMKNARKMK
jgi:hypothetical protein